MYAKQQVLDMEKNITHTSRNVQPCTDRRDLQVHKYITGCKYTKQQVLNMEKNITHYYYIEDTLYVDCTISCNISKDEPLEESIRTKFIPAISGRPQCSERDRQLIALAKK